MNTDFLNIFGLGASSKKVLLDTISHGTSSVAAISASTNMPKSSVYDALVPLLDQSLITEYSGDRGKTFGISDPAQLTRAHENKIEELKKAQSSLLSFVGSQ